MNEYKQTLCVRRCGFVVIVFFSSREAHTDHNHTTHNVSGMLSTYVSNEAQCPLTDDAGLTFVCSCSKPISHQVQAECGFVFFCAPKQPSPRIWHTNNCPVPIFASRDCAFDCTMTIVWAHLNALWRSMRPHSYGGTCTKWGFERMSERTSEGSGTFVGHRLGTGFEK